MNNSTPASPVVASAAVAAGPPLASSSGHTSDDIPALVRKWEAAKRAWNRDGGPIEKTVKAGEDLYFAADFLIEALTAHRAAPETAA